MMSICKMCSVKATLTIGSLLDCTFHLNYVHKKEKGKEVAKGNKNRFIIRKKYYTREDSDGLSNSEEEESNQDVRLLMAFEKYSSEAKDTFMDPLEENDFLEEINQLKICLEENKISIDTLKNQLVEK